MPQTLWSIAIATLVLNVPFGYWRVGVRKFSWQWFLAIHAVVPVVVWLRIQAGLGFRWSVIPVLVAAYFTGQALGARLHLLRSR